MFVPNAVSELDLLNSWEELLGAKKVSKLKQGKGFSFFQLIFSTVLLDEILPEMNRKIKQSLSLA